VLLITPEQAARAFDILVRHAGARPDERELFVRSVSDPFSPAKEYRFCGHLGFGGKFYNSDNRNSRPHVSCYREHLDERTLAIIDETNARLRGLFSGVEAVLPSRGTF
jgi:hypothetical protein